MSSTLQSKILAGIPGIIHGFGNRAEPIPTAFVSGWPSWNDSKPVWKQVHGANSFEVQAPGENAGEVDALYTRRPGLPIAVVTADCVPVLMARNDGGCVAAIHAGWRGTRARILRKLWERLRREGEDPSQWSAAIGPAIGPCCYEVSEELAEDFTTEFAAFAVPRYRHLDLPAINAAELRELGVSHVDLIRTCTRCSPLYFSYRRDGSGTRQWSIISGDSERRRLPAK